MDQMRATIDALRGSLTEVTTEVISLRAAANASATAIANLTATSNSALGGHATRMDQIDSDITDVQGHVRRGGGVEVSSYEREWDLLHKGDFKEFNGDKKLYRAWVKKAQAFCSTKRPGIRKALLWAAKLKDPITQGKLDSTQWEHIGAANTKLYDMLIQTCIADALMKIETGAGLRGVAPVGPPVCAHLAPRAH